MSVDTLVAYLHPDYVSHSFMDSLWRVCEHEAARGEPLYARFPVRSGPMTIPEARNAAVFEMLKADCDYLWFVDSDMGFRPDTLERLLALGEPVVGANCIAQLQGEADGMGGFKRRHMATLYQEEQPGKFTMNEHMNHPKDELVKVAATGCACLLIHKSALQAIEEAYGRRWFTRIVKDNGGTTVGEDLSFFYRLKGVGIPAYVHTGIQTTHHKSVFLGQ